MKAVKCDRCGNYFDKASDDHYQQLDICPECLEKFKGFMTPVECKEDN